MAQRKQRTSFRTSMLSMLAFDERSDLGDVDNIHRMCVSPSPSVSHSSFWYKYRPLPTRSSFFITTMIFAFMILLALGALPSVGPMGRHLAPRPSARPTHPITPFHLFVATTNSTAVENLKNMTSVISSTAPNSVMPLLKPNSVMAAATSKGLTSAGDFTDLISVAHHSVSLQPHKSDLFHTRPTPVPIALAPILYLFPVELAGLAINSQNITATFAPIAAALVTPLSAKPLPTSTMFAGHSFGFYILVITVFAAALCYWANMPLGWMTIGRRLPYLAVVGDAATKDIIDNNPTVVAALDAIDNVMAREAAIIVRYSSVATKDIVDVNPIVVAAPDAMDNVMALEAAIIANESPLQASLSTRGTATLHPSTRRHITTSGRRFNRLPWRRVVD